MQHGSSRPLKKTKLIRLSRDEIELRPEQTGEFIYRFERLDDKNYEGIKIDREVKQTVHPLAGVNFAQAGKEQKVWSCEGDRIQVPLELKVDYASNGGWVRLIENFAGHCTLEGRLSHHWRERRIYSQRYRANEAFARCQDTS